MDECLENLQVAEVRNKQLRNALARVLLSPDPQRCHPVTSLVLCYMFLVIAIFLLGDVQHLIRNYIALHRHGRAQSCDSCATNIQNHKPAPSTSTGEESLAERNCQHWRFQSPAPLSPQRTGLQLILYTALIMGSVTTQGCDGGTAMRVFCSLMVGLAGSIMMVSGWRAHWLSMIAEENTSNETKREQAISSHGLEKSTGEMSSDFRVASV